MSLGPVSLFSHELPGTSVVQPELGTRTPSVEALGPEQREPYAYDPRVLPHSLPSALVSPVQALPRVSSDESSRCTPTLRRFIFQSGSQTFNP